ncbi:hypothetical protein BKA81DRAFT_78710 [Phyllosticta paracitricarpa]
MCHILCLHDQFSILLVHEFVVVTFNRHHPKYIPFASLAPLPFYKQKHIHTINSSILPIRLLPLLPLSLALSLTLFHSHKSKWRLANRPRSQTEELEKILLAFFFLLLLMCQVLGR